MKDETTYNLNTDCKKGVCIKCNEESDELLIEDDICLDCIEEQKFYEETMKGL